MYRPIWKRLNAYCCCYNVGYTTFKNSNTSQQAFANTTQSGADPKIHEGGYLPFPSSPLLLPLSSLPPFPLQIGPLKPARRSGGAL